MANDKELQLRLIAKDMMSDVIKEAQKSMGEFADEVKSGSSEAKKGKEDFKILGLSLTDLSSGISLAKQGLEVFKQAWDFSKEGAENQRIAEQFDATAKSIGVNADGLVASLDRAAKGTVDDEVLMASATRAMTLGVATSGDELVKVMEVARASARQFGGDAGQAYQDIIQAVGNLQPRLLKQYGISVDLKAANEEYARALGKTADKLTEAEQRQALLNAVMVKAKPVVDAVGQAGMNTAEKMKSFETKVANVADGVKEFAANALTPVLDRTIAFSTLSDSAATAQDRLAAATLVNGDALSGMAGKMDVVITNLQEQIRLEELLGMTTEESAVRAGMQHIGVLQQQTVEAQGTGMAYRMINAAIADESLKMAANAEAQATAAAAQAVYRQSVAETVTKIDSMAQSLVKATDAQAKQMLAQSALDAIKTAYENGTISQQGFNQATDAVLLKYDLATPKSLAMAQAQDAVTKSFLDGKTPLDDFIASSDRIPKIAEDGKVTLQELASLGVNPTTMAVKDQGSAVANLKQVWDNVPRNVTTTYTIVTKGTIPEGGTSSTGTGNGKALGGPVYAGNPYIVGDNGREPFFPAVDGRILSRRDAMDALASSGGAARGGAPIINVSIAATMNSDQDIEETAYRVSEIIGRNWQAYQ